ncbi:MAG: DUF1800 domain-containing protein [Flavobacteriaceae bacterium]|nr:DUF1800 domain-containing protein [Flavobacteriaceae bacterium]
MKRQEVIHLYNRFGFGLNAKEIRRFSKMSFEKKLRKETVDELRLDLSEFQGIDFKNLSKLERMELRKRGRKKVLDLNAAWMRKMISSENIVQEKMNLFWHHHFACIIDNPIYGLQFTNAIRKHATGNFRTLLLEVSKSAAMIDFLHTRQNNKRMPNEDFARELCELFTLGRDREYTETDVAEIARCFTGWNHRFSGAFFMQTRKHDGGSKTIFGKTGNFTGEDVIDLILQKKACAQFICENIYTYFVNPVLHEAHVNELTEVLYDSNYDIEKLIIHIANAEWFYARENILAKIKSPIEFIVGLAKQFKIENDSTESWLTLQRLFDQVLYRPPNVKGWKVNREWIDSNSLPFRLRIPSVILTNAQLQLEPKPDYDANPMGMERNNFSKRLGFSCDWDYFFANNKRINFKVLFFNNIISPQVAEFLENNSFASKKEEVIQLISLPEYQLM